MPPDKQFAESQANWKPSVQVIRPIFGTPRASQALAWVVDPLAQAGFD
jgi:hypothetical protein